MKKSTGTILNIAAGKLKPIDIDFENYFLINLDTMYFYGSNPTAVEMLFEEPRSKTKENIYRNENTFTLYCNENAFTFMERTKIMFDQICVYRFLEHVPRDKISYFIYLISTCTKPKAIVDIIVPNYTLLAEMILHEKVEGNPNFEKHDILLTTELLNEKSDPHCSIWTNQRLIYYWELENKFKIKNIDPNYKFDGRDIYLRMIAERV